MCPHCGKNAPVVYRGVIAYCTACGRARPPLTGTSMELAGKGSSTAGLVTSVLGWLVLVGGVGTGLLVLFVLWAIAAEAALGAAIGGPIALVSLAFGLLLLLGGKRLRETGDEKAHGAQVQAIFALADNRRGVVTVREVATALDIPLARADAVLTDLAKTRSDEVTLEVDDRGELFFRFPRLLPPPPAVRIEVPPAGAQGPGADQRREAIDEAAEEEAQRAHEAAKQRRSR